MSQFHICSQTIPVMESAITIFTIMNTMQQPLDLTKKLEKPAIDRQCGPRSYGPKEDDKLSSLAYSHNHLLASPLLG